MQVLATFVERIASATLLGMLNRLRQTAPVVALLICAALLATWLTGAHAHWHVGTQDDEHTLHAWTGLDSDREHGHSHESNVDRAIEAEFPSIEHADGDHFAPHPLSLIHQDGHENIELQAVQAPGSKLLLDLPLLVCAAVLVLTRTQIPAIALLTDPPDPKRTDGFLRPPLRGPPSFSVA
jgi:hypothetical protein